MEKIIVYMDDAAYARENLVRLLPVEASPGARHWILVACPPRMTQRISKWVSHSARENWRAKWFSKAVGEITPVLSRPGDMLTPLLAKGSLMELTQQLKREHGAAKVVDARRPKIGVDMEPVAADGAPEAAPGNRKGWALPGSVLGMGALLILANDLAE
ncbi:MAG: hypothetical protein EOO29_50150 [Comamonadaceae bacterium]|nr:MAG: hypothetical protein EOO29_50150 [Comamonadaceae bacterium]